MSRRVATVSVICPDPDEGATDPSQLGTGDIATMQPSASTRTPVTFKMLPAVCLFSAAPTRRSLSTGKETRYRIRQQQRWAKRNIN